jgi:hypothetical protein
LDQSAISEMPDQGSCGLANRGELFWIDRPGPGQEKHDMIVPLDGLKRFSL